MVRPKKISEFKSIVGNVAQTSHYQVYFDGLSRNLFEYLRKRGVEKRFITENAGLLCNSASIPGSTLATAEVNGNFTGVQESFAHTRLFTELVLDFYVDDQYKMIKFLEHWMEYISSGSEARKNSFFSKSSPSYFYRMRYPRGSSGYKSDSIKIVKFERDYNREIEYTFIGMFPKSLSSANVQYGNSDTLKISCSFNYERYVAGKDYSLNIMRGNSGNRIPFL
tara:strand:- start:2087 stop:2755 length:669 start_codon:yes stop_codon:yes gene_type:complete